MIFAKMMVLSAMTCCSLQKQIMNKDNVVRAAWLTEAISGLEQVIRSGELAGNDDTFKRMLRYQEELEALKERTNNAH